MLASLCRNCALAAFNPESDQFRDEPGPVKKARIAVLLPTNGDLLEIQTHIRRVYIKGEEISLDNKQTHLYEKYVRRQ